jgi:hypothetical protein
LPCASAPSTRPRSRRSTTARWPTESQDTPDKESIMKIIVGHGMVGHKFLECLAEAGARTSR